MDNKNKDKVTQILEEAKAAPDDEVIEEETPEEEIEEPTEEKPEETPEEKPDGDQPKEESKQEAPKKPEQKPEDRFVESQKEAYILQQKNKKLNDAIKQAANLPEPTDQELQTLYHNWSEMPDYAKQMAKDNLINKRRFDIIEEQRIEGAKIEQWANKVDEFLTMDTGKTVSDDQADKFRSFCMKPTRRGLDFEDLRAAFLYNIDANPRQQHKGSLFNTANGGGNQPKDKPKELTAEEVAAIRQTDPKKYKKLVKEGKVNLL